MYMKKQWKTLIICVAIPLGVGILSALLTRNGMQTFETINKPKLSPPGWLFPIVWTILYILMGIASYLAATSRKPNGSALITYGLQLIFNFFWSIFFFNLNWYFFSFIWLVILWILIFKTITRFFKISDAAGLLMIPYLLWVTFAGYLNLSIAILN